MAQSQSGVYKNQEIYSIQSIYANGKIIMKKPNDKHGKTGRTWADLTEEYILKPSLKILKSITLGKAARYKPTLAALSFVSCIIGLWLMIVSFLSLIHTFVRSFNPGLLEINFTIYMFCAPKWQILLGVIIFALFIWYRETCKIVSDEPEKERGYRERTSLQRQLLLPFYKDDEIIKGTEDKKEEVNDEKEGTEDKKEKTEKNGTKKS
jgi:hypothetical protein